MEYIIKMLGMSSKYSTVLYEDTMSLEKKENKRKTKSKFLHSTFLNKDISFNIVWRSINFLTVILISILEGSVSHFLDICFGCFPMLFRKKINIIFDNILRFTS